MPQELSSIRRSLGKVSSDIKQGQYISAATAIRDAARLFGRVPMMKNEQEEFSSMLHSCVDILRYDKTLASLFPLMITYAPGQENSLAELMNELISTLQEYSAEEAIARQKEIKAAHMAKGRKELEAKEREEAKNTFEWLEREYPRDSELSVEIGELYIQMGLAGDGLPHLERSLTIEPAVPSLLNRLGIAYRKAKRYDEAEKCFLRALGLEHSDSNLFFNMGRLYLDLGQWEKVVECAQKALDLNPDFTEAGKMVTYAKRKLAV